jgi:hypothetical protein
MGVIQLTLCDMRRIIGHGAWEGACPGFLALSANSAGGERTMKGYRAMKYKIEQTEEEILAFDVSDEALEIAAGSEKANFTLGACTGLSVCDG